jgi:hypothetical protein
VPGGGVVGGAGRRPRGERGVRARQQRRERGDELVVAPRQAGVGQAQAVHGQVAEADLAERGPQLR